MEELPFFDYPIEPPMIAPEQDLRQPEFIFALQNIPSLTNKKVLALIRHFKTFEGLVKASKLEREQVASCGKIDLKKLRPKAPPTDKEIKIVTFFSEEYPPGFRDLTDAPLLLWSRGKIPQGRSISIVGTRDSDEWGEKMTHRFSEMAALHGRIVVSGLALGIDTSAHAGCLAAGGKTVAILACDIRFPSPKSNLSLAEEILEKDGCLIAEVPLGTQTQSGHLIARNRLQAAWSDSLFVTQTGIPSGALHTVRFALGLNRKLLVLRPSPIAKQENYKGNYSLIHPFYFDARILGGTKEFENKIRHRSPCADLVVNDEAGFERFLTSRND